MRRWSPPGEIGRVVVVKTGRSRCVRFEWDRTERHRHPHVRLALVAAVTLLALSLGAGTALADGGRHHGDAHNTFTKYVVRVPDHGGRRRR